MRRNMNCPNCNLTLLISDRQGIEIDYCPQCRGIWLDRGELEKLLARRPEEPRKSGDRRHDDDDDDDDDDRRDHRRGERRRSWWEIFD